MAAKRRASPKPRRKPKKRSGWRIGYWIGRTIIYIPTFTLEVILWLFLSAFRLVRFIWDFGLGTMSGIRDYALELLKDLPPSETKMLSLTEKPHLKEPQLKGKHHDTSSI